MDYNLAHGFCRRFSLRPLVYDDVGFGRFSADMPAGLVRVEKTRKVNSGRWRAMAYLPEFYLSAGTLRQLHALSCNRVERFHVGKAIVWLIFQWKVFDAQPELRVFVNAESLGTPVTFRAWLAWNVYEPLVRAAIDVIRGKEPLGKYLDWLADSGSPLFKGREWDRAMALVSEVRG